MLSKVLSHWGGLHRQFAQLPLPNACSVTIVPAISTVNLAAINTYICYPLILYLVISFLRTIILSMVSFTACLWSPDSALREACCMSCTPSNVSILLVYCVGMACQFVSKHSHGHMCCELVSSVDYFTFVNYQT